MSAFQVEVRADFDDLREKIDGGQHVEFPRSLRGRLHALETDAAASKVASEVLTEARKERQTAHAYRSQARSARKDVYWKALGAVLAVCAIVAPYLHLWWGH